MKPLCIAHRGKHDKYFENTLNAFKTAARGDYFGIETDIHLTKDNYWVIHHDPDFLSGGQKYVIAELTKDESNITNTKWFLNELHNLLDVFHFWILWLEFDNRAFTAFFTYS